MSQDDAEPAPPDPDGMLEAVEASPAQWRDAVGRAGDAPTLGVDPAGVHAVIVAGMGGSGIAGDVAATAAARYGSVPVVPVKSYELPAFAGPATPVVAVSFSGNTEETLSCLEAAGSVGASRYVVTSGGRAAELAAAEGFPVATVPGEGQPRANLPNLAGTVLVVLERSGLIPGVIAQLEGVADHLVDRLEGWAHGVPAASNPVKQLAGELAEALPVFYGGHGWMALAAQRAKCQVNENAERPAYHQELPELDHNEIVGWGSVLTETQRRLAVVELRSEQDEHPQVSRRFELTRRLLADHVGGTHRLDVTGPTPLARFAAAVLAVDLLSVELAFMAGVDPTPVDAIERLKADLAR